MKDRSKLLHMPLSQDVQLYYRPFSNPCASCQSHCTFLLQHVMECRFDMA